MSNSTLTKHLFVWSLPEEHELVAAWNRKYAHYKVYPLTYAAHLMAVKLFAREQVADIATLVSPLERRQLYEHAMHDTDQMMEALSGDYYLRNIDPGEILYNLFQQSYYAALIHAGRATHGEGPVIVLPMFSGSAAAPMMIGMAKCMDLAASEANWFHQVHKLDLLADFFHFLYGRILYGLGRIRRLGISVLHRTKLQGCDVLLVGFEGADRRNLDPVWNLLNKTNNSHRYIRPAGDTATVSMDEASRETAVVGGEKIQDVDWHAAEQSCRRVGTATRSALAFRFASRLRSVLPDRFSRQGARLVSRQLLGNTTIVARNHCVTSILSAYRPSTVLLTASHQMNRFAMSWAKDQQVDIIRLPHGVEYYRFIRSWWPEGYNGVSGRRGYRAFQESCGDAKRKAFVAGGMLFKEQYEKARSALPRPNVVCGTKRQILLPLSFVAYFFPDRPEEFVDDLSSINRALEALDMHLLIRKHPRSGMWMPDDISRIKEHHCLSRIQISDGSSSLIVELMESEVVIVRHLSGVLISSLYAGKPVIGWLPRPSAPYADEVLCELPCVARTVEDLRGLIQQLTHDTNFRDLQLSKQEEYFHEIIENPRGDAMALIQQFMTNYREGEC